MGYARGILHISRQQGINLDNTFHANEGKTWKTITLTRVYYLTSMAHNHNPTRETLILTLILAYCHYLVQNQSNVQLNFFKSSGFMLQIMLIHEVGSRSLDSIVVPLMLSDYSMGAWGLLNSVVDHWWNVKHVLHLVLLNYTWTLN